MLGTDALATDADARERRVLSERASDDVAADPWWPARLSSPPLPLSVPSALGFINAYCLFSISRISRKYGCLNACLALRRSSGL